jgi:hypothetical protein
MHLSDTEEKWEYKGTVHQLDFRRTCDSIRREVFYNILIEFGKPMKVVRLIKMCLNITCSKICMGKNIPVAFYIQNGLKHLPKDCHLVTHAGGREACEL